VKGVFFISAIVLVVVWVGDFFDDLASLLSYLYVIGSFGSLVYIIFLFWLSSFFFFFLGNCGRLFWSAIGSGMKFGLFTMQCRI